MAFKMLFTDMDNTLLNSELEISQGNREAIAKAMTQGIQFVLCTGRGVFGVDKYLKELELIGKEGYVICQDGGTVYDLKDGKLKKECSFFAKDCYAVIESAHRYGVDIQMYYDRILMAERVTERVSHYMKVMETNIVIVPDAMQYQGKLTKMLLNGSRDKLLRIKEEVENSLRGKLNIFFSNKEFLEVTALEATKGVAMLSLAKELGINKEEIIAVGDGENDLTMLEMAGMGVAVANAVEKAKKKANYVTNATCDEDALKEIIEKFILK